MNYFEVILAIGTVIGLSCGQLFFKLAGQTLAGEGPLVERVLWNTHLLVALLIYASATAAWVSLLSRVPLNVAYPFTALAFVVVPLLSALFLGEALRWQTMAGALLILTGVWVSTRGI